MIRLGMATTRTEAGHGTTATCGRSKGGPARTTAGVLRGVARRWSGVGQHGSGALTRAVADDGSGRDTSEHEKLAGQEARRATTVESLGRAALWSHKSSAGPCGLVGTRALSQGVEN